MYEMKLMDYGVKPCRILRRHIMSGYLRVLRALEWQMRDSLPVISAEAKITGDRNNKNILALAYWLWNPHFHGTHTLDRALGGI